MAISSEAGDEAVNTNTKITSKFGIYLYLNYGTSFLSGSFCNNIDNLWYRGFGLGLRYRRFVLELNTSWVIGDVKEGKLTDLPLKYTDEIILKDCQVRLGYRLMKIKQIMIYTIAGFRAYDIDNTSFLDNNPNLSDGRKYGMTLCSRIVLSLDEIFKDLSIGPFYLIGEFYISHWNLGSAMIGEGESYTFCLGLLFGSP